jgi:hypothetical protein
LERQTGAAAGEERSPKKRGRRTKAYTERADFFVISQPIMQTTPTIIKN